MTFEPTEKGIAESQSYLESLGASPHAFVVADEIVSNIVRCSAATSFSLDYLKEPDGTVKMVFSDDGTPFDPTSEIAEPDLTLSLESRPVGGLGIFMVRKLAKSLSYARQSGRNVLTVILPSSN